jgi:hypothetical protein
LGKLQCDWSWLISDKVLQSTSGDVLSKEAGEVIAITLLGKLGSDWSWLVSNEVLESTKGNILTKKG